MTDKKLDELFKQAFSDYSPNVPVHIWDAIAEKRKKKKGAFFWLRDKKILLSIALLLLTGVGVFIAIKPTDTTQHITLENYNSRQGTEKTVPPAGFNNGNVSSTINNQHSPVSIAHTNAGMPSYNNADTIDIEKSRVSTVLNKSGAYNQSSIARNPLTTNNAAAGFSSANKEKNILPQQHRPIKKNNPVKNVDTYADNNIEVLDESNAKSIPQWWLADVEGSRDRIWITKENFLTNKTIDAKAMMFMEECPVNTSGNNYYVEAYISPDYVIKKYTDSGNSVLVAKRKESLRIQSAFSAGIRYTRVFANGMSVRTGINLSQVNEKFRYAQDNIVQIVYIINNAGDTTDSYYVRGTRYKNSVNRYRTIDVPLLVGYEMGNGRFHANINAGVMVNVYSWQKGETVDNNGMPVSITTGKDDNPYQYKTNIGIGFTGAASMYYKLNERLHVLAEPYFRYNLAPMNKEALTIQERFTSIGLRLGVRVDIK